MFDYFAPFCKFVVLNIKRLYIVYYLILVPHMWYEIWCVSLITNQY